MAVTRDLRLRPGPACRAATLALALSLGATGCGGEPFGTQDDAIAAQEAGPRGTAHATVKTWLTACAEEDGTVVADILVTPVRDVLYAAPSVISACERVARLAPDPDPPPEELKKLYEEAAVEDVRVGGGFGTATVRTPLGSTSELELEKSRGNWALSNPPLRPR